MRAVVSGAAGHVGQRVIEQLLDLRWDVLGIVGSDAEATALPRGVTGKVWPKKAGAFAKALDGIDALLLCEPVQGDADLEAQVKRTTGLITAAVKAGVARIVLVSSAHVYAPEALARGMVTETTPLGGEEGGNVAVRQAALSLESALRDVADQVECVVLRPLMVIDRDQTHLIDRAWSVMQGGGATWDGDRLHPIAASDLGDAVMMALRTPGAAGHAFNVASEQAVTIDVALQEFRRLRLVLSDCEQQEIQVRPPSPPAPPVLSLGKAQTLLHYRAKRPVWGLLSTLAQAAVDKGRAEGKVDPRKFQMPAALLAIETGAKPLAGKVAVVTGATAGIGRSAAVLLSKLGAKVVAVARSAETGKALMDELSSHSQTTPGVFKQADLSELSAVRDLAADLCKEFPQIDILLNNAGAVFNEREVTSEGIERTLALNLISPFYLTHLLADPLRAAEGEARVINVSSEAHQNSALDLADMQSELSYRAIPVYGKAKSGLIMVTYLFAELMQGSNVTINVVSPGAVRTEIWRFEDDQDTSNLGPQQLQRRNAMRDRMRMNMISPLESAGYLVNLAMAPEFAGASGYYFDKNDRAQSSEATYDRSLALKLWRYVEGVIEQTTGTKITGGQEAEPA